MASGQNEAITVEPFGVLGVVSHDLIVENMTHRSTTHGQTRVTRVRFLDGIDSQESDRVDRFLNQRGIGGFVQGLNRRSPNDGGSDPNREAASGGGGGESGGFEGRRIF